MNTRGLMVFFAVFFVMIIVLVAGYASAVDYGDEDVNQDGKVNIADLSRVSMNIGATGCDVPNNWCNRTDVNKDAVVNDADIAKVEMIFRNVSVREVNVGGSAEEEVDEAVPGAETNGIIINETKREFSNGKIWIYSGILIVLILIFYIIYRRKR